MRIAKFQVPADVLAEFVDAVSDKGLNSTVVSRTRYEYVIAVEYDKDDSGEIDELEEELENLIRNSEEEEEDEG